MNNRYILNFGDSWAHGYDAGYENSYAHIMSKTLNLRLLDFSIPSTSASRMIVELQNFLQNNYDPNNSYTALFFITAQERQLLFRDNGNPRDMHVTEDGDYYGKYYTNRLGNFSLNTTVITLQTICTKYNINDYYMLGWQYPTLWPEVNTAKFYNHGNTNALNIIMNDPTKFNFYELDLDNHPGFITRHPSAQGHQLIANSWTSWIKNGSADTDLCQ
jgi:hypothetical protein